MCHSRRWRSLKVPPGHAEHREKGKEQREGGLARKKDRSEVAKDHNDQETKKMKHDVNFNNKDCSKKSVDLC